MNSQSYIFTCVDSFSKLVEVVPLGDITTLTVAKTLLCLVVFNGPIKPQNQWANGLFETSIRFRGLRSLLFVCLFRIQVVHDLK